MRTWGHYAPPPLRTLRTGKVPGIKLISCTLPLGKMSVCGVFHTLFFKRSARRNFQSLLAPLRCEIHLAPSHRNRFLIRGISDSTADSVAFVVNPQNTNGASRFSGFIKIPSSPAGRLYLIPFCCNLQPSSDVYHTWLSSPVVPCHTITSFLFCSHSVSWDTFKMRLPIWPTDPIPPCPEVSSSVTVLPTGTFRRHFLGELLSSEIWAKKERLLNRETTQTHVTFNWTINLSRFSAGTALRDVMEKLLPG